MKNVFSLTDRNRSGESAGGTGRSEKQRTVLSLLLWLLVHLMLILPGLVFSFPRVNSSFFAILPAAAEDYRLAEAESRISSRLNSRVRILVGHTGFQEAAALARNTAGIVEGFAGVGTVTLETGESAFSDIQTLVGQHRFQLIGERDRRLLAEGKARQLADEALAEVYSPFSFSGLDHLDTDPFLLTNRILRSYLEGASGLGGAFSLREGLMSAEHEGMHFIQMNVELEPGSIQNQFVDGLLNLKTEIENRDREAEIVLSGFPLHNSESSRNASREISIIAGVSMTLLTIILLFTFRSVGPWLWSILMIALAAASSFFTTGLVFREVHLFTLVFGTSLIGISIDYALHFFVARMRHPGQPVLPMIISGIGLGMITTVMSYLALALTPIPLLRQIAVFSIVGLFSAFCTVSLVFPRLKKPVGTAAGRGIHRVGDQQSRRPGFPASDQASAATIPARWFEKLYRFSASGTDRRWIVPGVCAVLIAAAGVGTARLNLNNDVRSFYTMSEDLAASEIRAARIVGGESSSRYFIILADSAENLLQREHELGLCLSELENSGDLESWIGVSRFVPSLAQQMESFTLAEKYLTPLAARQYSDLGFPEGQSLVWEQTLNQSRALFMTAEKVLDLPMLQPLSQLWLGEIDGKFASVVMPSGYDNDDKLAALAGEGIYWNRSVEDVSRVLQTNSIRALRYIVLAYLLIFLLLLLLRGFLKALKITLVPLLAALLTTGLTGWTGAPFNLFSVFGLILALGIGIDYAIFLNEGSHDRSGTLLAIALSCLSTLLSFGALSLSSFAPVADFGRSVLFGVLFSFLLAPFITGWKQKRRAKDRFGDAELS